MTKQEAIYRFFSGFGVEAYEESQIKDGFEPSYPYITYSAATGCASDGECAAYADLWFKDCKDLKNPNALLNRISEFVGSGGIAIPCDGGGILIKRAKPFSKNQTDKHDADIRRVSLRFSLEYLTQS